MKKCVWSSSWIKTVRILKTRLVFVQWIKDTRPNIKEVKANILNMFVWNMFLVFSSNKPKDDDKFFRICVDLTQCNHMMA